MATIAILLAAPAAAGAAGYGISDNSLGDFGPSSVYQTLQTGRGIQYARIVMPYNTFATYNAGANACEWTYTNPANTAYYDLPGSGLGTWPEGNAVYKFLQEAQTLGLQPLISISWGNSNMASATTDPTDYLNNPASLGAPGMGPYDYADYFCGVEGFMYWASANGWNLPVNQWEVFNEPDGGPYHGLCGSAAAGLYPYAADALAAFDPGGLLVAGAFSSGDDPLVNHADCHHSALGGNWFAYDYTNGLLSMGYAPPVWSWHPYEDVDASYNGSNNTQQTQDTALYVNNFYAAYRKTAYPQFWLTEAGASLPSTSYPELDGNPTAQANAAEGFLNLQNAPNQHYAGQISRVYWAEFQTYGDGHSTGSDSFDSALLGIDQPDFAEDGSGVPRASYCVLAYGDSAAAAATDPRCDYAAIGSDIPWTDWEDCFSACTQGPQPGVALAGSADSRRNFAAALAQVFRHAPPTLPPPPRGGSLSRPLDRPVHLPRDLKP